MSYAVYRDDGLGSTIDVEVNTDNDVNVRDLPSLDTFEVTNFPENSQGRTFRFQVKVITTQHEALSEISFMVLAGLPSKPSDVPISDPDITNDQTIKVTFGNP